MDALTAATAWEVRALPWHPAATPPGSRRWGVFHLPTGRWVAFGSEARCQSVAVHLTEVDAILCQAAGPDAAGGGARR
jgi:hypothetical protein